MNKEMESKWTAAVSTGARIPIGRMVVCDVCGEDFTDSDAKGGMIFVSSAYCPVCTTESIPIIEGYHETKFIKARAGIEETFADFVRRYRWPNSYIQISPGLPT